MGIEDRDYMREEAESSSAGLPMVIRMCAVVATAVFAFIILRVPMPIVGRFALMAIGFVLIRWLFTIPKNIEHDFLLQRGRQLEREGRRDAAIHNYEEALARSPRNSGTQLRLLAAYNDGLQVNKAKGLINGFAPAQIRSAGSFTRCGIVIETNLSGAARKRFAMCRRMRTWCFISSTLRSRLTLFPTSISRSR